MLFTHATHSPIPRRLTLALLVAGLASCQSSSESPGPDGGQNPGPDSGTQETSDLRALKADLIGLVASDYPDYCIKFVDDEPMPVGSGSTFTISKSGQASWGFGTIDMLNTPTQDFGIIVGPDIVTGGFDLLDPITMARQAIISVIQSADGFVLATVTDNRTTPSLGDGCSTPTPPALVGADVWQMMNRYIHVPPTKLRCIDLKTGAQLTWEFSFDASEIKLDALVTKATDPRAAEHVQLSEIDPKKGFSYILTRPDQQTILVDMTPTLSLVELISPDGHIVGCNP